MTYLELVQRFDAFLRRGLAKDSGPVSDTRAIAVYVTPWLQTLVPFYSLTTALLLRRTGRESILVFDDLVPTYASPEEWMAISATLNLMSQVGFKIVRLSCCPQKSPDESDTKEALRLARLNALWWWKSPVPGMELSRRTVAEFKMLSESMPKILGYFASRRPHSLIIPGGIFRNSGLMLHFGKKAGVLVTSYDSGYGSFSSGVGSVAAHLDDVPQVIGPLMAEEPNLPAHARQIGERELALRVNGTDKYRFQPVPLDDDAPPAEYDVLFPLNLDNDSSALGKHQLFADTYQWLNRTIAHLLERTDARICVRQHPYEARLKDRNDSLCDHLERRFAPSGRFRLIRCDELVNTYSLVQSSRVILPFVTSLGLESILLGRSVVMMAGAFYAGLSCTPLPASRQGYFGMIEEALRPRNIPAPNLDEAWVAYYLSQICGRIWTKFTPQPSDGLVWMGMAPEELAADADIRAILDCLGNARHISRVQHERIKSHGLAAVYHRGQ